MKDLALLLLFVAVLALAGIVFAFWPTGSNVARNEGRYVLHFGLDEPPTLYVLDDVGGAVWRLEPGDPDSPDRQFQPDRTRWELIREAQ